MCVLERRGGGRERHDGEVGLRPKHSLEWEISDKQTECVQCER